MSYISINADSYLGIWDGGDSEDMFLYNFMQLKCSRDS